MLVVMDGQCLRTILNALPELGQYLVVNVGLGTDMRVVLLFFFLSFDFSVNCFLIENLMDLRCLLMTALE